MTSQIPFTPLTPEALSRLTPDERNTFALAAEQVAAEQKPSMMTIAGLVETVGRLIGEQQPEAPAAELAALKRTARSLADIVARNHQAMEAARIEMRQNGPHAGMQWILNSLGDVWDDPETEWDGKESAQAWFDRTESFYRAARDDAERGSTIAVETSRAESPAPVPASPAAMSTGTLEPSPVAGRVEQDTATAGTLITPALLAEIGRRLYEYENAIEWGTSCLSCARVLDSSVAETFRREEAEAERDEAQAKLAGVRSVLLEGGQDDATARRRALAITGTGEGDHG